MFHDRGGPAATLIRLACPPDGARLFALTYAHFRWADDVVDAPGRDREAVARFAARQMAIVAGRAAAEHQGEHAVRMALAEEPRLRPIVDAMWEALAFDAGRGPEPIAAADLDAQIRRVGEAYARAVWACSGGGFDPPEGALVLGRAATAVHALRDMEIDLSLGYCNVPAEDLGRLGIDPATLPAGAGPWLAERIPELRGWFRRGRAALSGPWRSRALVAAYAWRYERALDRLTP